jgi:hypothetical protein
MSADPPGPGGTDERVALLFAVLFFLLLAFGAIVDIAPHRIYEMKFELSVDQF